MNIKELTLEQCKALAYDEGKKLEIARQNLMVLNQRIKELEDASSKVSEVRNDINDK